MGTARSLELRGQAMEARANELAHRVRDGLARSSDAHLSPCEARRYQSDFSAPGTAADKLGRRRTAVNGLQETFPPVALPRCES